MINEKADPTETVVVFTYSRADAIRDGVLIDVSETAREAGFKFPVALTDNVYNSYVKVPPGVSGQDEKGRLWDVLWMLRCAIQKSKKNALDIINYRLFVRNHDGELHLTRDLVDLKAVCGPGDDAAPVITIMLPGED